MEAVARGVLGAAAELVGDVDPLGAKLGDGAQDDVVLLARPRGALALGRAAWTCLLYTSPSPRDRTRSRMPSSA